MDKKGEKKWGGRPTEVGDDDVMCWKPNDFLAALFANRLFTVNEKITDQGEGDWGRNGDGRDENERSGRRYRYAVDVGCGSGRDAVYLAMKLPRDFVVIGIDNHKAALSRAQTLANRSGVPNSRIRWVCEDVRKAGALRRIIEQVVSETENRERHGEGFEIDCYEEDDGLVDVVHGCRFLDSRLLLEVRDDSKLVSKNGLFIWSTFSGASEEERNPAPPHRPSRRLVVGELGRTFCSSSPEHSDTSNQAVALLNDNGRVWETVHEEEGELVTRGVHVPASFFAARLKEKN